MIRVAINGFGRIGRMVLRAGWQDKKIEFVAINDLTNCEGLAYLLQHDSVHGRFSEKVNYTQNSLTIGKRKIPVFSQKDPSNLPWKNLQVDVVIEATGHFTDPQGAKKHLLAGAKKVIISAPCKGTSKETITIVKGVNDKKYKKTQHHIISNASCTTNCVAPLLNIIEKTYGISSCLFTTTHAYTATQHLVDGPHKDLRRARAAAVNIIPTSTGADKATAQVIPELKGKISGTAIRVPVPNGSVTDFSITTKKPITAQQVNNTFKKAAKQFKGVLEYSEEELVSTDIIGNPHSCIVDSKMTKVVGKKTLNLLAWYDNEWGYSNRVLDLVKLVM